ncbi:CesT family type III secretion system chaperone [Morganella sp. GD04133]|uniref:CesT family type III secretion system chaperone n=1 Tax=Morganella sp. GD04133 TaxID=2975435 RepID=UPI00244CB42E|nr:CesT family type III secretion system chaperone [Morganella sp. GD04133]MDH0354265.1 CesT family type III secretion system chaperone [Morganella sp. GD04133]
MEYYTEKQIAFLAEKLGVNIIPDIQQQFLLIIDGHHFIVRLLEGKWYFHAKICYSRDIKCSSSHYKKMLAINMNEHRFGFGVLCLSEEEDVIMYVLRKACDNNEDSLYNMLDMFVNRADAIRKMIFMNSSPNQHRALIGAEPYQFNVYTKG